MKPAVSVIIPAYNCREYISETIESVLAQTYRDYEIIVIDDGSTDDTSKVLEKFSGRIIYHRQKNSGVSAARNKGISLSSGKWVALLDHDDLWMPDKLEKQVKLLESNPLLGLVYSDMYIVDKSGAVLRRHFNEIKPHRGRVFREYFYGNFIPCLTVVISRKAIADVGLFSSDYTMAEEYDLIMRIVRKYDIDFVDTPLGKYRMHDTNLSRNVKRCLYEEIDVLNKLLEKEPEVYELIGKKPADNRFFSLYYRYAKAFYSEGNFKESRKYLKKSIKLRRYYPYCYLLYILTFLGKPFISPVVNIKRKMIKYIFGSGRGY